MMNERLLVPESLDEALSLLSGKAADAAPLAGATWLMRAPLRGEASPARYVALGGLKDLNEISITDATVTLGAGVTHARLVAALGELPQLRGLADAAGRSANPAIRQVATLGGNLCAVDFPAADLPPALLALEASVLLHRDGAGTAEEMPLEAFLAQRAELLPGALVTAVTIPRTIQASAHVRLPLKAAGDYPVAIVSVARGAERLRIAVGSVGPVARRWQALEEALETSLQDGIADADRAAALAAELSGDLPARDGVEAPASYRRRVLPALVRRAFTELITDENQGRVQP